MAREKLRSVDLFCGIGGMTLGLEDVAHPVLYCEIDKPCQALLRKHMDAGALPRAPLHDDVRTLHDLPEVDLITAGWPCQDISAAGKKAGFEGDRSGLIYQVLRLADRHRPPLLFLENVSHFLSPTHDADRAKLLGSLEALGYRCAYGLFAASDVGAPHLRLRFFLMGCRSAQPPDVPDMASAARLPSWDREPQPRMVRCEGGPAEKSRLFQRGKMLGNSVVPACVRLAFKELSESLRRGEGGLLRRQNARSSVAVRLDPAMFPCETANNTLPRLLEPRERLGWATPRASNHLAPARCLTHRSASDVPTQVRFAADTTGDRTGIVNVEWIEWLMGYPAGWTQAAAKDDGSNGSNGSNGSETGDTSDTVKNSGNTRDTRDTSDNSGRRKKPRRA